MLILLVAMTRPGLRFHGGNAPTGTRGGIMNARCGVSLLLVASSLLAGAAMIAPVLARDGDDCVGARDVKLVNGKIHTLDARNSIVSSVTIKNGKFAAVGHEGGSDG